MQCVRSMDCIMKIFDKNRVSVEHFFFIFCKDILSIKLFLRNECDKLFLSKLQENSTIYRLRIMRTFISLLCCSAAYLCDCKSLDNAGVCY